jgi:2-keto-myo-inositol isomerase
MKLAINQATLMKTPMDVFLEAISKAGFEGVELRRDETFEYLKNNSIQDLNSLLETNNLECITFNAIELFSLCTEIEFQKILDYTERLMKIGVAIGCNTIIAVPSFLEGASVIEGEMIAQTVDRLRIIAEVAKKYDFEVEFEPLGFLTCSVRKIDLALKIIENENLPEMGLVIDTFHYFLGEHAPEDVKNVDVNKIWLIHINDSIEKPLDQLRDEDRVMPADGFFDLKSFIENLKLIGYDGWMSIELFNKKLWEKDPYVVSVNAMSSLKKFL